MIPSVSAVCLLLLAIFPISLLGQSVPAFRVQTIAGSNRAGDGDIALHAVLLQAEGMAVATDGTLYIADAGDHRIRSVSPAGLITTIAGDGSPGFDGDGGPAVSAHLNSPYGLSLDKAGNLYVADLGNARIRMIRPGGLITTVAGGGALNAGTETEGSDATLIKFVSPRNVLADEYGGVYFSDFDAHRVYYIDSNRNYTVFAGTGTPGYGAENIAAIRSSLRNPAGLAFDPQGGVLIVESGSQRIRRVARGTVTSYLAADFRVNPLYSPTGLAFDTAGNLYIADARSTGALKRTPAGLFLTLPVAGASVASDRAGGVYYALGGRISHVDAANRAELIIDATGAEDVMLGDGGAADAARLLAPAGLAYDTLGNLYIAEERNHRVRKVTPEGKISTVAGKGKAAFTGDGGLAVNASLNAPRGLAVDPAGNLFIADSDNNAIRRVTKAGVITTIAGNAFPGFRGDGGQAVAAQLNRPSALALSPAGDLYVADSANHRIRRISSSGIINTYAGSQSAGFAGDGESALVARLNDPRGLTFDTGGSLYIADTGNNRIRRVDTTGRIASVSDASLQYPRAVVVDLDGTIYAADTDGHRIVAIRNGSVTTAAGISEPGYLGDGGSALAAKFQYPSALVFDGVGNLLVADLGNNRVRRLIPEIVLAPGLSSGAIFNAASNVESVAVPGMLASIYDPGLTALEERAAEWTDGRLPRELNGVEVRVAGIASPLLYVSRSQINFQIPYEIASRKEVTVNILQNGAIRSTLVLPVGQTSPGLFGAAVNEDGSLNSVDRPAERGSVILLYATGEGSVAGNIETGRGSLPPYATPLLPVSVTVGGMPAQVLWAGTAPGYAGLLQINVRLPSGFYASGSHPVKLIVESTASQTVQVHIR